MRKVVAKYMLLFSAIVLVAHIVLPHHHHNGVTVAFELKHHGHGVDGYDTSQHSHSTEESSQNSPENTLLNLFAHPSETNIPVDTHSHNYEEECLLNNAINKTTFSSKKQTFSSEDIGDHLPLLFVNLNRNHNRIHLQYAKYDYDIDISSSYIAVIALINGLRAPPLV